MTNKGYYSEKREMGWVEEACTFPHIKIQDTVKLPNFVHATYIGTP